MQVKTATSLGLSPRARGNRSRRSGRFPAGGTIPACAGEPNGIGFLVGHRGDYPRVRGGTALISLWDMWWLGLSPRARGNRYSADSGVLSGGTIPACAGEPRGRRTVGLHRRDYPRVRGGTAASSCARRLVGGLSPRARGNPTALDNGGTWIGTIPACAGEPVSAIAAGRLPGDYPRVRGGTYRWRASGTRCQGLSPRARGNHQRKV